MPRKLVKITLAGARKSELVAAWERLGFAVDSAAGAIDLADGVTLEFFGADDAQALGLAEKPSRAFLAHFAAWRGGMGLLGLSGAADAYLGPQPRFLGAAECFFELASPSEKKPPAHPNGVIGLKILAAVADDPADHAEFLAHVTNKREMRTTSAGLEIGLGGANFDVLTPSAFAFRFGAAAPDFSVFRLAGLIFAVENLGLTEVALRKSGVAVKMEAGRLYAGPREGAGVLVVFEPK